jgi:hypothetical protein
VITESTVLPWPSEDVSRAEKLTTEYGLAVSRALWSRFSLNLTMWGFSNVDWFTTMTNYVQGRQPDAVYRDWFCIPTTDKTGQTGKDVVGMNYDRKAYTNIDYTIRSLAPKFAGVIKSKLSQSDHRVKVFSRNPQAIKDKAKKKGEMYVNSVKYDWEPKDKMQVDLYDKMNGFALPLEYGLQQMVNHGYDISNWSVVRLALMDRLIEHGMVVGKVCANSDGAVTFDYIHPGNFICEAQDTDLQSEPSFAGHIEKRKIKDIKPQLLAMGLTSDQIRGIAMKYAMYQPTGFGVTNNFNYNYRDPVTSRYIWEDFVIDVFCFQWITVDSDTYVKRENKDGGIDYFRPDRPEEFKDKDYADGRKRTKEVVKDQTRYDGEWIVGENFMLSWGRGANIIWPTDHKCATDYVVIRVPGQSIGERWKPFCDDFMKVNIKVQAAVNEAKARGLIVDVGILSNMDIGWGTLTPLEVTAIAKQTNIQLINSNSAVLDRVDPTKALRETEGGIGQFLQEMIILQNQYAANMQEIAGITDPEAAAPSKSDDKLKFVTEQEIQATNNALWTLKDALKMFKEKMGAKMAAKGMILVKNDPKTEKYYEGLIGPDKVSAIKEYEEYSLNQLWIQMAVTLSDQRKREIMANLKQAQTPGRDGSPAMTSEEGLVVTRFLEEDNMELAELYMNDAIRRHEQQVQENLMRAEQANQQGQQQSAFMAEQAKQQTLQLDYSLKSQLSAQEFQQNMKLKLADIAAKHEGDMKELALEGLIEKSLGATNDQDVGNKV